MTESIVLDAGGFASTDSPVDPRRANALLRDGNDAVDHIAAARKATFIVAALTAAYGVYLWFGGDPAVGAGVIVEGALLGALAWWAVKSPRVALAIITVIYVGEATYATLFEAWNSWAFGIRIGITFILGRGTIAAFRLPGWVQKVVEAGGSQSRIEAWSRLAKARLYRVERSGA